MNIYKQYVRPLLFCLPPEVAHRFAIFCLKRGLVARRPVCQDPRLVQSLFGLSFPSPVGLAAGFDKNAEVFDALSSQPFGFIEVGTVTLRPQVGNPRPRMFRLVEDEAIVNRLGFNNKGIDVFMRNLGRRRTSVVVGANIGINKDCKDPVADYLELFGRVCGVADYVTVNISSPNTPGLRDLQKVQTLDGLLGGLVKKKRSVERQQKKRLPLFLKIAPDGSPKMYRDIAVLVREHRVDGLVISNTTVVRSKTLQDIHAIEPGGLSGRPLFTPSTVLIRKMYQYTDGKVPIIGVGGIFSGDDAYEKIRSGASLVQVYSGLVYEGIGLVERINARLSHLLERDGFRSIKQAVGSGL